MSSEPTKGLPPQDVFNHDSRQLPPPYPGLGQPEVIGHTVTHVHMTSTPIITTGSAMVVTAVPAMGIDPCMVTCRSCNLLVTTRVDRKPTMKTHVIALLLCLVGCWPCVCIPYCADSCLNADHYCPNCNAYLGTYQS